VNRVANDSEMLIAPAPPASDAPPAAKGRDTKPNPKKPKKSNDQPSLF
jgi:hypothetical protein